MDKKDKIIFLHYSVETIKLFTNKDDFNYIAIMPPSEEELKKRLINRGREKEEEEINKRMNRSKNEIKWIKEADFIDYIIINNNIDECFKIFEKDVMALYPQFF